MRTILMATLVSLAFAGADRPAWGASAAYEPTEVEVKAAFLFHFAQLVTWPDRATDESPAFVIAIVGSDPFGKKLEATIGSETVHGLRIRIERAARVGDLRATPDIVYLGTSDPDDVERALAGLAGSPVLTIAASKGFARRGGMIEFRVTPESRVAFDINVRAVESAGLRMSSQLLKIARIVEPEP